MAELHPNLKSKEYGRDRHSYVPVRSKSDPDLVLRVIDDWISECLGSIKRKVGGERGRKDVRLFYYDRIFEDLMFRFTIKDQPDGSFSRELILARVAVRSAHRNKGYFRALLTGLEQFATKIDAHLKVESANTKLSRILLTLGYLRCNHEGEPQVKIRTKLSGSWRYDPQCGSVMALIELPSDVLPREGRGGHSINARIQIDAILNDEVALFVDRVKKRLREQITLSAYDG